VTNVQRLSLLVDLAMLFWFYNRQRRQRATSPDAFGIMLRRWVMCLWIPMIVVGINLAWLNVLGPNATIIPQDEAYISPRWKKWKTIAENSKTIAGDLIVQPFDLFLCPEFNLGCRFLRVDHRTLIGKVWDSKAIVELGAKKPLTDERRASFEGVFLRSRTLRFAQLSESRFYIADMISADLTGADLSGATLTGADLSGSDLSGSDLTDATVEQAQLDKACGSDAQLPPSLTLKPCPPPSPSPSLPSPL
jgi:hypothetical protein